MYYVKKGHHLVKIFMSCLVIALCGPLYSMEIQEEKPSSFNQLSNLLNKSNNDELRALLSMYIFCVDNRYIDLLSFSKSLKFFLKQCERQSIEHFPITELINLDAQSLTFYKSLPVPFCQNTKSGVCARYKLNIYCSDLKAKFDMQRFIQMCITSDLNDTPEEIAKIIDLKNYYIEKDAVAVMNFMFIFTIKFLRRNEGLSGYCSPTCVKKHDIGGLSWCYKDKNTNNLLVISDACYPVKPMNELYFRLRSWLLTTVQQGAVDVKSALQIINDFKKIKNTLKQGDDAQRMLKLIQDNYITTSKWFNDASKVVFGYGVDVDVSSEELYLFDLIKKDLSGKPGTSNVLGANAVKDRSVAEQPEDEGVLNQTRFLLEKSEDSEDVVKLESTPKDDIVCSQEQGNIKPDSSVSLSAVKQKQQVRPKASLLTRQKTTNSFERKEKMLIDRLVDATVLYSTQYLEKCKNSVKKEQQKNKQPYHCYPFAVDYLVIHHGWQIGSDAFYWPVFVKNGEQSVSSFLYIVARNNKDIVYHRGVKKYGEKDPALFFNKNFAGELAKKSIQELKKAAEKDRRAQLTKYNNRKNKPKSPLLSYVTITNVLDTEPFNSTVSYESNGYVMIKDPTNKATLYFPLIL